MRRAHAHGLTQAAIVTLSWISVAPILASVAIVARLVRNLSTARKRPRLLWAGVPLLSLVNSSRAMREKGYVSEAWANDRYRTAPESAFDRTIAPGRRLPKGLNTPVALMRAATFFAQAMFRFDVLHGFFNGAVLGRTPLRGLEYRLWKLSGGKLVVMPYGSDAFVYARLQDQPFIGALERSYPRSQDEDEAVAVQVDRTSALADIVLAPVVHDAGLPRIDRRTVLWYPADLDLLPAYPAPNDPPRIVHASNHRAIKGTDALIAAVERMRADGLSFEFDLIENVDRPTSLSRLEKADIVVEQLHFGYGLTALEAMALGKPVVTAVDDDPLYAPFRKNSHLDACPAIPANVETIEAVLRDLLQRPHALPDLGRASRAYVERFHGNANVVALFEEIYAEF